jgi:DHA1 family tetracycline resistance protein-like MFS transporter
MSEPEPLELNYESPGTEPPAGGDPPRGALGVIFLIVLIDLMGFGIIIPLLPFLIPQPEQHPIQVTMLFSVYSICQFIGAPVLGAISDRRGRKPILGFSQLGSAAGYVLLGVAMQPGIKLSGVMLLTIIYLSRVIDGFTGGNISTAQAYISDITTGKARSRAMALLGVAFGLGFAFGPWLGGELGRTNKALPAYAAGALSFVAAVLSFAPILPESRTHRPLDVEAWLHPSQFKRVFAKPILAQLLMISFFTMAAFVMMESTIGIFLKAHYGYEQLQLGRYFLFIGLVILIVQGGIVRRLLKTVGDWPLAVLGPALVSLGMVFYVWTAFRPVLSLLLVAGAVNASGRSCQQPTLSSLLAQFSDRDEQGIVFGLYHGLGSLARVFGPIVAGIAYPFLRNTGPFVTAGVITAAGALWTWGLRRQAASATSGEAQPIG